MFNYLWLNRLRHLSSKWKALSNIKNFCSPSSKEWIMLAVPPARRRILIWSGEIKLLPLLLMMFEVVMLMMMVTIMVQRSNVGKWKFILFNCASEICQLFCKALATLSARGVNLIFPGVNLLFAKIVLKVLNCKFRVSLVFSEGSTAVFFDQIIF